MRRSVLLTGLLTLLLVSLHPVLIVQADSLVSSPNPSEYGQEVTFTATFLPYCADGANGTFTVDGVPFPAAVHIENGTQGVATFTTSSLGVGDHSIVFTWSAGVSPGATCGGTSSLTQTVNPVPTPPAPTPPAPPESTSPSPEPSVEATPTDTPAAPSSPTPSTASAPRLNLTSSNVALVRVVTGALFAAGLAAVLWVRRRVSG
ncbi:MAG TPA: Ig-like domain-containing protein [Candidatus Dormibacteraeota bacterium]|nr:Ig-like domain-containing protein [Candidatus Dormibacteraeota bacterium]